MKKPKVTPWFNCREHNPVRPGLYEVQFEMESGEMNPATGLFRFNGGRWRECVDGQFTGPEDSEYDIGQCVGENRPGFKNGDQWRGLTEPSNG